MTRICSSVVPLLLAIGLAAWCAVRAVAQPLGQPDRVAGR